MHLEWHMVSIFFRGLQFVFILHINNHILSDQRCTYPPYDAFSKGREPRSEEKSTRTGKTCRDVPQGSSPAFKNWPLRSSNQEEMLLH